jgi:hypothetical protein
MPIFFPDNDNRKARVLELGSEAQNFLYQATDDFNTFTALLSTVNSQIADAYREAGLEPPKTSPVDILKDAKVDGENYVVDVAEILTDIAGFIGTVKYLAPGATKALVAVGAMSEETAAKVLTKFTIPLFDKEISITVGDVAGNIVGGIVGGIAVAGIDLAIDAIEGSIARDKLRDGINHIFPLRGGVKLSQEKAVTLLDSLRAVKTTLDAITGAGIPLTEQLIKNLINRDVSPSIQKEQAITVASVATDLLNLDKSNNSWTNEDPAPSS